MSSIGETSTPDPVATRRSIHPKVASSSHARRRTDIGGVLLQKPVQIPRSLVTNTRNHTVPVEREGHHPIVLCRVREVGVHRRGDVSAPTGLVNRDGWYRHDRSMPANDPACGSGGNVLAQVSMERSALGHMAGVMSITLWPTAHKILHREQGQGRGGREHRVLRLTTPQPPQRPGMLQGSCLREGLRFGAEVGNLRAEPP